MIKNPNLEKKQLLLVNVQMSSNVYHFRRFLLDYVNQKIRWKLINCSGYLPTRY